MRTEQLVPGFCAPPRGRKGADHIVQSFAELPQLAGPGRMKRRRQHSVSDAADVPQEGGHGGDNRVAKGAMLAHRQDEKAQEGRELERDASADRSPLPPR